MKQITSIFALLALLALTGCGGDQPNPPLAMVKSLSYQNPAAAPDDWQLMQDATSTRTRLVLNLVGPADGSKYRGVGFTLQVDTSKVKIGQFTDADNTLRYYRDGGILLDQQMDPDGIAAIPPLLQAGGVNKGKLMVGIFQKADDQNWNSSSFSEGAPYIGTTAKDCFHVVLQIALELDGSLNAPAGPVALEMLKAKVIPEHIDNSENRKLQPIDIQVGTLSLQ